MPRKPDYSRTGLHRACRGFWDATCDHTWWFITAGGGLTASHVLTHITWMLLPPLGFEPHTKKMDDWVSGVTAVCPDDASEETDFHCCTWAELSSPDDLLSFYTMRHFLNCRLVINNTIRQSFKQALVGEGGGRFHCIKSVGKHTVRESILPFMSFFLHIIPFLLTCIIYYVLYFIAL